MRWHGCAAHAGARCVASMKLARSLDRTPGSSARQLKLDNSTGYASAHCRCVCEVDQCCGKKGGGATGTQTSRSYWLMESERVSSHLSVTHLHMASSMNVIVVNNRQTNEKRTIWNPNRIGSNRSQQGTCCDIQSCPSEGPAPTLHKCS